jgi:hypothetical protein
MSLCSLLNAKYRLLTHYLVGFGHCNEIITGDLNILQITLLHFGEDFSLMLHIVNIAVSLVGKL